MILLMCAVRRHYIRPPGKWPSGNEMIQKQMNLKVLVYHNYLYTSALIWNQHTNAIV